MFKKIKKRIKKKSKPQVFPHGISSVCYNLRRERIAKRNTLNVHFGDSRQALFA